MRFSLAHRTPASLKLGLRNRLLLWLVLPLCVLAVVGAWMEYIWAGQAANRADQRLARLLAPLSDSVLETAEPGGRRGIVMIMAPAVEEFLRQGEGYTGYSVRDLTGQVRTGDEWIRTNFPRTQEPEFHSIEYEHVLYRVALQRAQTAAGELIVAVADGSDPHQQWWRQVLLRVLLPNLVLVACAALAIHLGVRIAFQPLEELTQDVERRSPRDLRPIVEARSPLEVRPLVRSLNRLFELVEEQSESQRRFVADAAHQLRTPLAGLQAQVEAWAMSPDAQQPAAGGLAAGAQIEKLRDAARRTSKLAHQLLALSRVDQRVDEELPDRVMDLVPLCEATLEDFLDAATLRGIDLGLDTTPVQVRGHGWLLRELLSNLVDNAIKYCPQGANVTIRCGFGENNAPFLEVEDDGPGLPPEEQVRVVERFYRSGNSAEQGSGLGLSIADEIARLHHAQLAVVSGASGRGLSVRVHFFGA